MGRPPQIEARSESCQCPPSRVNEQRPLDEHLLHLLGKQVFGVRGNVRLYRRRHGSSRAICQDENVRGRSPAHPTEQAIARTVIRREFIDNFPADVTCQMELRFVSRLIA